MGMTMVDEFYKKIREGYVIGPFMKTCDPAFVEAAGYAGMDFVILDMEHGPVSVESLQNHIQLSGWAVMGIFPVYWILVRRGCRCRRYPMPEKQRK